jgi:hypothetical protein
MRAGGCCRRCCRARLPTDDTELSESESTTTKGRRRSAGDEVALVLEDVVELDEVEARPLFLALER